jgi:chitodextrinase
MLQFTMNLRSLSLFFSISCLASAATPGWTALPNTKLKTVCPGGGCENVINAWSGGVADTQRNRLIIWGGGHDDYYGNEVYALDLNANPATLTRITNPSPANPDHSTCPTTLSDGNPNSRHTYNGLAYMANVDKMFAFNGALACAPGKYGIDTWTFDIATLKWKRQDPVNGSPQPSTYYGSPVSFAAYDPNTSSVLLNNLGNLFRYDYATNKYSVLNSNSTPPFNSTPVIDPKRKLLFYIGSNSNTQQTTVIPTGSPSIKVVDISPGSNYAMQDWTNQVTGCNILGASTNPGLAYDSANDRIVGWPNFGNTVYIFDPATKSCSTQTYAGGPADSVDFNGKLMSNGTFGRFQYFPALDAFVLVNFWTNDAYMLRLSTTSTPADSVAPTTPTNLTAVATSTSQINLSWTASTDNVGVAGYRIFRGGSQIATVTGTSYSNTGLSSGTTYSYTVVAYDPGGNTSAQSAPAAATTQGTAPTGDTQAPTAPSGLTATAMSSSQINLSWNASTDNVGVVGYSVYRGGAQIATVAGLFYQDRAVAAGASYSYTVVAYDAASNTSAHSGAAVATTPGAGGPPLPMSVPNTMTITNTGAATANYPVQIGRPFAQGEIGSGKSPQASINGTAVPTQVDAKTRWPDGSLRHAVISFVIPNFGAGQTVNVAFAPGAAVGNTALTSAQMLAANFNFNAHIALTKSGVTHGANETYSARTMLTNGDYTVWASGPIATTILLGNHAQGKTCGGNAASAYDFGFDSYCAFRPLFQATFWAATNQVFVRYIGEIANTEQLESVSVDSMALMAGNTNRATVYSRSNALNMHAASRWTKTAWIGGTPPVAGYNHNLAYLAAAKAMPNYDTTKTISSAVISGNYAGWVAAAKDLYDKGKWDIPMKGGGGHPHVGPFPAWVVEWMYTGDYRSQERAIGQADLISSLEIHHREGKAGKKLDRAGSTSGVGYPLSISTRPTLFVASGYNNSAIAAADKITPVGALTNGGWGFDPAHQAEPFAPVYLVTGDFFYLEEDWFLASYNAAYAGVDRSTWRSRGPTGAEGGIPDKASQIFETRGQGWAFRNRVEAAALTPDASPMKTYLNTLVADNLAYWEGQRNVTSAQGSIYQGSTMWNWGNKVAFPTTGERLWDPWEGPYQTSLGAPPLHFWDNGSNAICDNRVNDMSVTKDCNSPWMEDYVLYGLGRAVELGYTGATALRNWLGANPIGALTDAGYNPYLAGAYRSNTIKVNNTNFNTWAEAKSGFIASVRTETDWYPGTIYAGGQSDSNANVQPLLAAVSMVADQSGGAAAWSFMASKVLPQIGSDLKWALIPRSASTAPPPPPTQLTCDLNTDGRIDQADIQIAINQALGVDPCTTADLQQIGRCSVVGVQRVINASLGGACVLY